MTQSIIEKLEALPTYSTPSGEVVIHADLRSIIDEAKQAQEEGVTDEREEFEAWFRDTYRTYANKPLVIGSDGDYIDSEVQNDWRVWQARAAKDNLQAGEAEEIPYQEGSAERLRLICSKLGIGAPVSNEEIMLCQFSLFGAIRRKIDELYRQPPDQSERIADIRDKALDEAASSYVDGMNCVAAKALIAEIEAGK